MSQCTLEMVSMRMGRIFRCSPLRFVKFTIVCIAVIGLVVYFPRDTQPHNDKTDWYDYINPDNMHREHQLKFEKHTVSIPPTKYTNSKTINFNHTCVHLKVGKLTSAICVYDRVTDNMISASIIDHGKWEEEQVETMISVLNRNKHMQVIDIGCNVGVYTIAAAKIGRKVIALDPVQTNLQLLDKALKLAKIRNNVTLVHNAISNHAEIVSIDLRRGNIGSTHVKSMAVRYSGPDKPHRRVKRYKRRIPLERPSKRVKKSPKLPKKSITKQTQKPFHKIESNSNKVLPGKRIGPKIPTFKKNIQQKNIPNLNAKSKKVTTSYNNMKPGKQNYRKNTTGTGTKMPVKFLKPSMKAKQQLFTNQDVLKQDKSKVQAITLDDLVSLKPFKPSFLKIDIDGWEGYAFNKSAVFISEFNVKFIMMGWSRQRMSPGGDKLLQYMVRNGFMPHKIGKNSEPLNTQKWTAWPDDILWIKR